MPWALFVYLYVFNLIKGLDEEKLRKELAFFWMVWKNISLVLLGSQNKLL